MTLFKRDAAPIAIRLIFVPLTVVLNSCSGVSGDSSGATGRISSPRIELKIVEVGATVSSSGSTVKSSNQLLGEMYLDSQIKPASVLGTPLQASDISIHGGNVYVAYNAVDSNGMVIKKGAVEHFKPQLCVNGQGAFCTSLMGKTEFPKDDIFAIHSDGAELFAVGSTGDESAAPKFARLYKIGLDAKTKAPTGITGTTILPSYAGTGVVTVDSNVLVTTGTSTDTTKMGGLSVVNRSTMAVTNSQPLYDARSVATVRSSGPAPATAFITRGAISADNAGAILEYNVNGASAPLRTIPSGGNTIPESKSSLHVGKNLLIVSLGDKGFKVVCKTTGATLVTNAAPVITGIPASRTVTNSVIAIPGYIFAANGEAGVYVYRFSRPNENSSNYCHGVHTKLLGRLALDSDDDDATYFNGELSANSVHYMPIYDAANLLTARLVVVASGNKGVSLLNVTGLKYHSESVDDF